MTKSSDLTGSDEAAATVDARWQHAARRPLCAGRLVLKDLPVVTPTCVKLCISAPYTDFKEELYVVETEVTPKLKEYCRIAHGVEFDAVHIGAVHHPVKGGLTAHAKTLSLLEIEDAKSTSIGPCFIALVGQRYGLTYGPPASIAEQEFQQLCRVLQAQGCSIDLLTAHYRLDENASEVREYHLYRTETSAYDWQQVEKKLTNLLCLTERGRELSTKWPSGTSDLHDELDAGILSVLKEKARNDNCLCFRRIIDDVGEHLSSRSSASFVDLSPGTHRVDERQADALRALHAAVEDRLSASCLMTEHVGWAEPNGIDRSSHAAYLQAFGRSVFEQVRRHVDVAMVELQAYPQDDLFTEILQHWHVARELELGGCFGGHEETLLAVRHYVANMADHVLVCHGPEGSGKSTIMAKIACELATAEAQPSRVNGDGVQLSSKVVVRFIGVTPDSTGLLQLLLSLISQIEEALDLHVTEFDKSSLPAAKSTIAQLLSDGEFSCRLVLILDGLDHIDCSIPSAADFEWLPVRLPANVKVIVSACDDTKLGALARLQSRKGSAAAYTQVQTLLPETCLSVVEQRLSMAGRRLTDQQQRCVNTAFNACYTPYFAEAVFNEVRQWTSDTTPRLVASVDDIMQLILQRLEAAHNATLVAHALCYVTVTRHGLSEAELQDVLSLDDEVLSALFDKWEPAVRRMPRLAWVALKHDLAPYWRRVRCRRQTLLRWRHDQFATAVRRRYLLGRPHLSKCVHGCLADYFLGTWHGPVDKPYTLAPYLAARNSKLPTVSATAATSAARRHVVSQPTLLVGHGVRARYNERKLVELPLHLCAAGRLAELGAHVLFNFTWMLAKISALGHALTLDDYALLLESSQGPDDSSSRAADRSNDDAEVRRAARLVADALAAAGPCDPRTLGTELSGRLLPITARHASGSAPLRSLIRQCDLQAARLSLAAPGSQLYVSPMAALECAYESRPDEAAAVAAADLKLLLIERADRRYACTKPHDGDLLVARDTAAPHDDRSTTVRRFVDGPLYITPDGTRALSRSGLAIAMWDTRTACLLTTFDCGKSVGKRGPAAVAVAMAEADGYGRHFRPLTAAADGYDHLPTACAVAGNDYFCFAVSRTAGPYVLDLSNAAVLHRFRHQCTALALDDDGGGGGGSRSLACNDGRTIYCYGLPLADCKYTLALDDLVTTILFASAAPGAKLCTLTQAGRVQAIAVHAPGSGCARDFAEMLQDATIEELLMSHARRYLLARAAKWLTLCDTLTDTVSWKVKCRDVVMHRSSSSSSGGSSNSITGSQTRFTDACFSCDDTRVVAACHYYVAVCSTSDGAVLKVLEAPLPVPIRSLRAFRHASKFVTLLENGAVQLWNLDRCLSPARYTANYFPNGISSLAVSHNGKVIVCCSSADGNAKVVSADTGTVVSELSDPFAHGTQPLEVDVSPCGRFAVTRCSNEAEGSVSWPALRSDYVWDVALGRVTHFFSNSLHVIFGGRSGGASELLVAMSCLSFHSGDPSNKQFMTLSYRLADDDDDDGQLAGDAAAAGTEHQSLLPEGDVIGRPLLHGRGRLVCLLQPCVKTRLSNILVEQRMSDIQLLVLDLFTRDASDRRLVRCRDLLPEVGDCYFIDARAATAESAAGTASHVTPPPLILFYARGRALPPYRADGQLNRDVPLHKGMLVYDVSGRRPLRHVGDFPRPTSGIDSLLVSRQASVVVDGRLLVQDCSTGRVLADLSSSPLASELKIRDDDTADGKGKAAAANRCGSYALALDGAYIVAIPPGAGEIVVADARDGEVRSRCAVHGKATAMLVGVDDRTVHVGCSDGRIMALTLLPHASDPMKLLISQLPSRQA